MRSSMGLTAELADFGGKWIASNSWEEDVQERTVWDLCRHCHRGKVDHREECVDLYLHDLVWVPSVVVIVIRIRDIGAIRMCGLAAPPRPYIP